MSLREYFSSLHRRGVVPVLGYPGLTAEKVTAEECLFDPTLHTRVVRSNVALYGPDAALPLLDLTVEAESFGVKPIFKDADAPQIREFQPLERVTSRARTTFANRMSVMVDTAKRISDEVESVPKGFYVTGPFTLAGQIIGVEQLLLGLFKHPELISELMETCTLTIADYARHLEDAGVDFLVMADPTSSLVSPKQFDDFAKLPIAQVVKATSKEIVLHICGRSGHLLRQMVETGVAALSLDNNVRLTDAVTVVPNKVLVFGNYSPSDLAFKKTEAITAEVREMLSTVTKADNVVVSTGCDIPASAPPENIRAFMKAAKIP